MASLLTSAPTKLTVDADGRVSGDFMAEWAEQTAEQELVNRAAAVCRRDLVRRLIVALADRRHAAYSQYAGHWSGPEWNVGTIRADIRTKGGLRFAAGDVVIYKTFSAAWMSRADTTAYSVRGGVDCAISLGDVI